MDPGNNNARMTLNGGTATPRPPHAELTGRPVGPPAAEDYIGLSASCAAMGAGNLVKRFGLTVMAFAIAAIGALHVSLASAAEHIATPWTTVETSRVRLVAGRTEASKKLVAGIEIEMADDWKTYWRNPGSSGVPPRIDWSQSGNLASARLAFPAPSRFADRDGDTIGYKKYVVLPLELTAADATRPIDLKLSLEYGVCKDICIPVEVVLSLAVPVDATAFAPDSRVAIALAHVPRAGADVKPKDPVLKSFKADLAGGKPTLAFDVAFPGGAAGADLFVEAPEGLWVPLARKAGESGETVRFEIDLTDGADIEALKGKALAVTLVSDAGQSETSVQLP
jgi:DsbC/DsbD-like thiol-disulfide interchange protein